jgi:hypothetical protein
MAKPRLLPLMLCLAFVVGTAGCNEDNGVTSANLSLVRLSVDAPSTIQSGATFGVQVRALNVGLAGVHEGHVTVRLPAPLTVLALNASSGTSATFSNAISGATVEWNLASLDSNSQSKLDITTMGVLTGNEGTKKLTVVASMTANGIKPGDATAQGEVTLVE